MTGHRAKPFSSKQKKVQLQEKRRRKAEDASIIRSGSARIVPVQKKNGKLASEWETRGVKLNNPYTNPEYTSPIITLPREGLETSFRSFYQDNSTFDIPVRPEWRTEMTKNELEKQEETYFLQWINNFYESCAKERLSYFEHNLEVWRQLWRVCEISDIVVVVVDIRNPVLHFPPSLYAYVIEKLKKKMIVALMKSDLVDTETLNAWQSYLNQTFPMLEICPVSIYPESNQGEKRKKRYVKARGVVKLLERCRDISMEWIDNLDEQWNEVIRKCAERTCNVDKFDDESDSDGDARDPSSVNDEAEIEHVQQRGYLTLGFIGHPNVGKSSLINSLTGKKVTIHLSSLIRLCDCPGLIFPMMVSKHLQVLSGLYNVAQVSDPYGPLKVLAGLADLPRVLKLTMPDDQKEWTVMSICEEYAMQRGFLTSKASRPDTYRAANMLLRSVLDGRILLSWKPPGFFESTPIRSEPPAQESHKDRSQVEPSSQSSSEDGEAARVISKIGGSFSALVLEDS